MSGRMEFEFAMPKPEAQAAYRVSADTPLRILVLGDFTGRENRGVTETGDDLAERPLVSLDVDVLEDVLYRFSPRLNLPLGDSGSAVEVEFRSMDDFHPDELYRRLEVFGELRGARNRLMDPATFAEAAAELSAGAPVAEAPEEEAPEEEAPASAEDDASTLARLLGKEPSKTPQARVSLAGQDVDVSRLIRDIVAPHVVPDPDPRQESLVASVDEATAAVLRGILHHPAFQGLEAAWRGAEWLVRNVETDETLTIHLLDVSKEELIADLAAGDPARSGIQRLLVEKGVRTPGGQPWSVLAGAFTFGPGEEDAALLAALGSIASQAGGPFLAAASPAALGCASIAESPEPGAWSPAEADASRWRALRASPAAPWLGLALPRVLLRLPYGARTDEIDSFAFEETSARGEHESFLWGNPAFALAILLAESFRADGWAMQPGSRRDVGDLPAHTWAADGESGMTACAEAYLGETAGEAILARGVMPLMSLRNLNSVRVLRFQSLAEPPRALAGPWG